MPMILAQNLQKSFTVAAKEPGLANTIRHFFKRQNRVVEAVKPCSFSIEPGEFVGFLGPNGAGKTTTLKMLSGLIHPTAGTVEVAGHIPFNRERAFQRTITLVMGNKQQLIWDLPALESFRINAAIYDVPQHEADARVKELADMLQIDKQLTQPVRKLSLGERMKAELMASLIHQPQLLFLDEPTLGLDVNAQVAVRTFLKEYVRKHKATVLLTSHYMADITALCKRVMLIHQGTLMYDGTLDGIIDRFSPLRDVILELAQPVERAILEQYGQVEKLEGRSARIQVTRDALTAAVSRMLADLPISDLTVTDPPIEEIIGKVFTQGTTDATAGVAQ